MRQETVPQLRAGVSRANITPSIGIELTGFAGRGPSVGLGDELYATALMLDDGRSRVAIVHVDLLGLETQWCRETRELMAKHGRLPAENVLLCCTHTHYGPPTRPSPDDPNTSPEAAYLAELRFKLVGIVQEVRGKLTPVTARVGRNESDIGVNRRERLPDGRIVLGQNPSGPIDREVIMVRVDRLDGEPLACLLNFAAHPVSQTHKGRLISADFPGYARMMIEELTDATCLYLQGACGNINSVIMKEGLGSPYTLGRRLAGAAIQAYETASPAALSPIGVAWTQVKVPAKTFATLEDAQEAVEVLTKEHQAAKASRNKGRIYWASVRLEQALASLNSIKSGRALPPVIAPVWAVALGDLGIVTAPGEIFCEIGLAVKQAAILPHTLYVSNTNGSIGYVPVREAYSEGGYEVESASRVGPDAADKLTRASISLLRKARRARTVAMSE